jgi:hypothetical protein
MHGGEIIVPIVFFALVFGIVYIAISSRNKERMALIEKGADASIFAGAKTPGSYKWALVVGILSIGVAIGVLLGNLLESLGMDEDVAYPAAIFLFGGAALVASYFISKRTNGADK